jgi:nucleoside-diphosphate-sugar epimerase
VRVLVLGGTGSIGSAVLRELAGRGHAVVALARSDAAAAKASGLGAAAVLRGDIAAPAAWVARLPEVDAVVQMASDFASPMRESERRLLDALIPRLPARVRFIYTGGCWLFGATGDSPATERTAFSPLPTFAWMVPHAREILASRAVHGVVIHPGMVWGDDGGGVFGRFASDAREGRPVRVVGGEAVRWPLVHRDDLAVLYALALEQAPAGESYLGVASEGTPVGRLAWAFAHCFGTRRSAPEIVSADTIASELGEWARGYALDQRLSGAKARQELGWRPVHLDPEAAIARLA